MAVLASAGSLKESVAEKRISNSFEVELSSLFSNKPLFLSQDWAFFAEETELREAVICASRLAWSKKSQALCGNMVFWLLNPFSHITHIIR